MPSDKQARGLGRAVLYRASPFLAYLLGDCAPKAIAAKFGREKYHKRSENIGDNACGEGAVAWVDPTACPTEIQQKRTCLRIPAQSQKWDSSIRCSERKKLIYSAKARKHW